MSLADFMQELQTQDNIVYSKPPESAIRIIPPERVCTQIIPPENPGPKPPTTIKLKIKQKDVTATMNNEHSSNHPIPNNASSMANKNDSTVNKPVQFTQNNAGNSIIKKPPPNNNQVVQRPPQSNQQMQNTQRPQQQIQRPPQQSSQRPVQPMQRPPQANQPPLQSVQRSPQPAVNQPPPRPTAPSKPVANTPISNKVANNQTTSSQITDEQLFIKSGTELSKRAIWMDYFAKAKSSKKSNEVVNRMKLGRFTITPDNKVLLLPDYDIVGKDPDDVLRDKWF